MGSHLELIGPILESHCVIMDDFGGALGRSDLEFDMVFTDPNACAL